MIGHMTQWSPRRWLRWSTVLMVAWGVFWLLQRAQVSQQWSIIQWWRINPDASVEEVINHIQMLPDSPVFKADIVETESWTAVNLWEGRTLKAEESNSSSVDELTSLEGVENSQELINLEEMLGDLLSPDPSNTHNVSNTDYQAKYDSLCQTHTWSCAITVLDGTYTPQQQFAYQLMVTYIVNKLSEYGYNTLNTLRSITVNNYTRTRRWYANARIIVLNTRQIANNKEFLQVLVHEMWHVVDLGVVRGTSPQINPDYTEFGKAKFAVDDQSLAFYAISWANENTLRSRMTSEDFVSGYGMSNPFEDFAECHNMYLYHRDVFAYMASSSRVLQQKYDYFDRMYQTQKLSANFNPTDLTTLDVGFRPWDTTRM